MHAYIYICTHTYIYARTNMHKYKQATHFTPKIGWLLYLYICIQACKICLYTMYTCTHTFRRAFIQCACTHPFMHNTHVRANKRRCNKAKRNTYRIPTKCRRVHACIYLYIYIRRYIFSGIQQCATNNNDVNCVL